LVVFYYTIFFWTQGENVTNKVSSSHVWKCLHVLAIRDLFFVVVMKAMCGSGKDECQLLFKSTFCD